MDNQFTQFQEEFKNLKKLYKRKKITESEFKTRLKRLQFKDLKGRTWTIGAQTGNWYYYDGKTWVQGRPPSLEDKKAICIYCGAENDLENDVCIRCGGNLASGVPRCPKCGARLEIPGQPCPVCDGIQEEKLGKSREEAVDSADKPGKYQMIRSIDPSSLLLFLGGMGFFVGLILGAFAGATGYLPGVQSLIPVFLRDLQGGLAGGVVYSLYGGVAGFSSLGLAGLLTGFLSNLVISFFGGIKIDLSRMD